MPNANPETTASETPRRRRTSSGRVVLILLLVPLLVASSGLYKAMPRADLRAQFDGRRPFVYWKNEANVSTDYTTNPHVVNDELIHRMNVDTGEITIATKGELVFREGLNSHGERLLLGRPPKGAFDSPINQYSAYFKNMNSGETRHVEFDFPYNNSEIVNNRFIVGRDAKNIYAIDLEDAAPQAYSILSPFTGMNPSVKSIYGTEILYEIHAPAQPTANTHKLEFFKLGEHQIQLVKTIEMGCSGVTKLDDHLLTLSTDLQQVEFRSLIDLEFVKAIEISSQFLSTHEVVDLQGNLLIGRNKQTFNFDYFDILTGESLELPFSGMGLRWWSGQDKYWCFNGGPGRSDFVYVYDSQAHRICLALPYACKQIAYLEDGRFAVAHPNYGVSTVVYDLKTGKSIRHAPYHWCAWAIVALLLAWFAWWVTWIVVSASEATWIGLDLTLIYAILPTILTILGVGKMLPFIGFWGSSTNFAILNGTLTGLLIAAGLFSALSCERWAVAFIPLTLGYSALNYWLSSIAARPRAIDEAYYLRVSLILTVCLALLIVLGLLMRQFGFRWIKSETDVASSTTERIQVSVLDLFIFMACAGTVAAALRPLVTPMPRISINLFIDHYWFPTTITATAISIVVILTVLNKRSSLAKFGVALSAVIWCNLVLQQVLTFAGSSINLFAIAPSALQTIAMTSTSAFICAFSLRLRRYRIMQMEIRVPI